ncbi:hypothetical protein ACNPQM_21150 [Streptomyces sp. NPDC056231]|uniref:hypothetical protein n=1 Tax=Streptomyces sp. NPDC056231 TaxID=3345755 RepID=UPI003AAF6040
MPADQPDGVWLVRDDAGGLDDLVTGGLERDGEAAAVRGGAGDGLGGLDQHGPQGLIEREQGSHRLFKTGRIARAEVARRRPRPRWRSACLT